jgi:tetratricopeptide (TPR) repeat protein
MVLSSQSFRSALLACVAIALPSMAASAAEPLRIVLRNGRAVPLSSVTLQGANLTLTTAVEGFTPGQVIPLDLADHVFGDKPSEINPAIALLLMGKPSDALKLLEPIIVSQRLSAQIPGNYWLEAARAALVAYALEGNTAKCTDIGKEISEATPAQGGDSFVSLGKALLMPASTKVADREVALRDLTTDNLPSDVCAYASFFRGNLLKAAKRDPEALEAYLMVTCLFPTGGMILSGVAELNASEYLKTATRREEAVALLKSAISHTTGTLVVAEANKRLESLK